MSTYAAILVLSTFFVFDDLDRFEEYCSGILLIALNSNFSDAFIMIILELCVFDRSSTHI